MTEEWDAVIVGGGVAGLSAAQMLGRSRRSTLVIDGGAPRNRFAAHMHGVLGHDGLDPAALLARGRKEARAYGVVIEHGTVTTIGDDGDRLRLVRDDGTVDTARVVILATGIRDALPAVPGLADGGIDVVTDDDERHALDALFAGGAPTLDLDIAAGLALARGDQPGAPVAVDMSGATSHPRVFAAGNVIAPFANVPVSMGSGSMAGAAANARLATEDSERAVAARTAERNAGWEQRYAESDRFWSGRVNVSVATVVETLAPGRALDIGSGEGGDVVWLAEQGWRATGVDVSPTAVARARAHAAERGVEATFVSGDGAASVDGEFDLVLASFLHSWEDDFPRLALLRDAAARVAPGGHLLVVSHVAPPPWAREAPAHMPALRTPEEELALLGLDPAAWQPEIVEIRRRPATAPDGTPAHLDDGVLLLRCAAG